MSNFSTVAQFRCAGLALLAFAALSAAAQAQEAPAVLRVTDALVAEALAANLGLDERAANVDQQLARLDQVRAEYLPQIDLHLRYSEANGGRTIEVPELGLDFRFLREREQDSYVRLTQPIYYPRLAAERRGASHVYDASRHGLEAYRLRVTRDVRQAYYRWLTARASIGVLEATAALAAENERVNESLYRNGKVTRDFKLSAEAEHLEIAQQILRARAAMDLARRYLNLLLLLKNACF
jgi:outer membrane protein TolC